MPTVDNYTALLGGSSWWGGGVTGKPIFLTYSFNAVVQPYLPVGGVYDPAFVNSFTPLSDADRTLARSALSNWAEASGITFFEVPGGQGDLQFGKLNFDLSPTFQGYGGFAQFAFGPGEYDFAGDIFISSIDSVFTNSVWLYMHEIGHALGLKHPRDGSLNLPSYMDTRNWTVMAERPGDSATDPLNTGMLSPLDHDAIKYLYGAPGSDGNQVASWAWDAVNYVLSQTGGAAADSIHGVHVTDRIHGGAGGDFIFGDAGNDELYGEDGNDRIFSGHGDDLSVGGEGNDIIYGEAAAMQRPGNDRLYGGGGDDTLYGERGIVEDGGNDQLFGEDGDDTLYGDGGSDMLVGGDGVDTGAFAGKLFDYTISQSGSSTIVSGADGTDTLTGVERLTFSDITITDAANIVVWKCVMPVRYPEFVSFSDHQAFEPQAPQFDPDWSGASYSSRSLPIGADPQASFDMLGRSDTSFFATG